LIFHRNFNILQILKKCCIEIYLDD
jgi:hypothetical protein